MLCSRCESLWSETVRSRYLPPSELGGGLGGLSSLYCEQCGAALPISDATEALLGKLSQLARFGLSAGDRPILAAEAGCEKVTNPLTES